MMATETQPTDMVATGRAFAEAYAAGDFDGAAALLDTGVRYREITPNRVVDATGVAAIVDEGREFLARFDGQETLVVEAEPVGDRVRARTRWRLQTADGPQVVDWCQYMTVRDARITVLDALCSGPMVER